MKREKIAAAAVASAAERRKRIEGEPLPANIAQFVNAVSREGGSKLLWHFVDSDETLTYAELEPKVKAIAAGFSRIGIGKGSHVAVMLPNIAAMPLVWLAIGALGAVMIPLNTGYSEREIAYVMGDSDAQFIVTDASHVARVGSVLSANTLRCPLSNIIVAEGHADAHHALAEIMEQGPGDFEFPVDVGHDDLLNIQYTSGTTGFPKGCMLSQRYWLSAGKVNAFRDGRVYRRIWASTPFYYMDPQWLLLMTMYQSATLYVAQRQSASKFIGWLRRYEIEFCLLPVLTLKQPQSPDDAKNAIIRANVYSMPTHLHAEIETRFDLCAREAFGMTEVGPTLYVPIEAVDMVGSGSCGIPCPFRECRVVDAEGNPVSPGVVGELIVRGPGILLGYYNRPDATQAAFFGDWFRTGDLCRMDESGYFYLVGRIKDMIRRSGENIAAREVESVLSAFPDVVESAVLPVKDDVRGEEIKALIIWRDGVSGTDSDIERLIAYCQRNLAPFKVPRFFESRDWLPKTGSSKIAKHLLLAEQSSSTRAIFDRSAAPRRATEVSR